MSIVENESVLGDELAFYAKFPEEMDLIYGEPIENFQRLFSEFLDENKFKEMNKLVTKIGDSAAAQAREITSGIRDILLKLELVKTESIKHTNYWESGLRIKKSPQTKAFNIECRVIIETEDKDLVARVRIWVNGVNRSAIQKVLSSAIENLPTTPKNYGKCVLVVADVNLSKAIAQCRTKQWLIEELSSPLFKLSKSKWDELFILASSP